MLVSRRDDGLWLVTHPDHAALAAELARAYGNDELPLRAQRESLVTVAGRHDDGWAEIDARPAIAEDEGRPAHFLEVALPDTVEPYRAGVDRIYADDRYAGVLASRHWAGLYRARWGTADAPPVGHPLAGEVVAAEDQRAARTALELWDGAGPRSAFEAELWRDYEVLQALDLISLALCLLDTRRPSDPQAPDVAVGDTLRTIEQPPGARLIERVPAGPLEHRTLRLAVKAPGVVEIDPFPFAQTGARFALPARRIEDRRLGAAEAAAAFHAAEVTRIELTLTGRG